MTKEKIVAPHGMKCERIRASLERKRIYNNVLLASWCLRSQTSIIPDQIGYFFSDIMITFPEFSMGVIPFFVI